MRPYAYSVYEVSHSYMHATRLQGNFRPRSLFHMTWRYEWGHTKPEPPARDELNTVSACCESYSASFFSSLARDLQQAFKFIEDTYYTATCYDLSGLGVHFEVFKGTWKFADCFGIMDRVYAPKLIFETMPGHAGARGEKRRPRSGHAIVLSRVSVVES